MSLHLKDLLHGVFAIAENLNRARAIWFCQASVDHIATLADEDLRVGQVLLVLECDFAAITGLTIGTLVTADFTDGSITAGSIDDGLLGALRLVAGDRAVTGL